MAPESAIRILLIEDNPVDAKATLKAAAKWRIANHIEHLTDGHAAIEYLHRHKAEATRPDLVLLDLNLPGKDGRDVLADMKGDHSLRRIPVVILTTSEDDADIVGAYDLGANAYITKPVGLDGWMEVVNQIEGFWFTLVKLPRE